MNPASLPRNWCGPFGLFLIIALFHNFGATSAGVDDPLPLGALARLGTQPERSASVADFLVLAPDGKRIAIGEGATVRLWDVRTARVIHTFVTREARKTLLLRFSQDSRLLAVLGDHAD